jgi:hypothetical protein
MWKVGRTPEEEQEAIRDWAKRNGHVPKPDFCQICNKRPPETLLSTIEENHVRGDRTGYLWSCYTCCRRHIEGF